MAAAPGLEVMLGAGLGRSSQPVPRLPGSRCGLGQGDQGMGTSDAVNCLNWAVSRLGLPRDGIGCVGVQWPQAWLAGLQCHGGCGELWGSCLAAASTPSLT